MYTIQIDTDTYSVYAVYAELLAVYFKCRLPQIVLFYTRFFFSFFFFTNKFTATLSYCIWFRFCLFVFFTLYFILILYIVWLQSNVSQLVSSLGVIERQSLKITESKVKTNIV